MAPLRILISTKKRPAKITRRRSSTTLRPPVKTRRTNMSIKQRREALEKDRWVLEVISPTLVRCDGCKKEITLDRRSQYYVGFFTKHKGRCPGIHRHYALQGLSVPRKWLAAAGKIGDEEGEGDDDDDDAAMKKDSASGPSSPTRRREALGVMSNVGASTSAITTICIPPSRHTSFEQHAPIVEADTATAPASSSTLCTMQETSTPSDDDPKWEEWAEGATVDVLRFLYEREQRRKVNILSPPFTSS